MHHHRYATVAALSAAILGFGATGASAQDNTRYTRTLDPRVVTVCANGDTITLGFDITVNRHIQEYDESGQPLLETRNIVGVGTFTDVATGAEISFRGHTHPHHRLVDQHLYEPRQLPHRDSARRGGRHAQRGEVRGGPHAAAGRRLPLPRGS